MMFHAALVVEDDPRIARVRSKGLREQAYAVDVVGSGEEALYQAAINTYDLAILDVDDSCSDGFAVCRELRNPVSACRFDAHGARRAGRPDYGLDCRADDYLTKPFEFRELLPIAALVRRPGGLQPAEIVVADLCCVYRWQNISRRAVPYRLRQRVCLWSNSLRATPVACVGRQNRRTFWMKDSTLSPILLSVT